MNTMIRLLAFIASCLVILTGCANNKDKTVLIKSTVLGVRVDPYQQGPGIRIGLVRDTYLAAPAGVAFTSHVDGQIGATTQRALEDISIDSKVITPPVKTNAPTARPSPGTNAVPLRVTNSAPVAVTNATPVKPTP